MIGRTRPLLAAVLFGAACVRQSTPVVVTVPVVPPPAPRVEVAPQGVLSPASTTAPAPSSEPSPVSTPLATPAEDSVRLSPADVARRATEVFGADTAVAAPVTSDPAVAGPTWDIDVHSYESTARVAHYVQLFTGPAKERIQARLERGTRYEPMIRAKMRDGGLPEDMYYLALIESGFDANAYSRAAAVGLWQFMTSTARDMGMRVDWWVDERRDPVASTVAAVRFIRGLKEQFGSLYLAAAAYNGGPGRVARGLTRYADDLEGTTGDDLFFALAGKDYLRNETREYVPQLIAAALIAKEPERYGMVLSPRPPLVYDSVRVGPLTPLPAIAQAAGMTVADAQDLNPQILRGITPPKDSVTIHIPVASADSFADAYAALPKSTRVGIHIVESKKGESLGAIARRQGLTARQLALYNPKLKALKSGNLAAGQTVLVPTEAVVTAAAAVPDPAIERYSTSRSTSLHVVKSGETLSGLAKRYHTTTATLMKANGLRRALIFPGQSLVVGSATRTVAAAKTKRG